MAKTRKVAVTLAAVAAPVALMALIILGAWVLLGHALAFMHPLGGLQQSTIEAHVPEPEDFDRLLKRDLESHFGEVMGKQVTVTYELLRDGPSQAGLAYPKYYAWVGISDGVSLLQEGVVRVGAMDKASFYVTHYFSADNVKREPTGIRAVFADDVCEKIEAKIKAKIK